MDRISSARQCSTAADGSPPRAGPPPADGPPAAGGAPGHARLAALQVERLGRIGHWELDLDAGALSWSLGTYRIFGLDPELPVTLEQAIGFYPPAAQAELHRAIGEAIASGTSYDITLPHTTADGDSRWVRAIGEVVAGEPGRRLVGVVRDVTDERALAERLRHLANHDPLTGLPNRRLFLATLHDALAACADGRGLALLILDVDRFKDVNDLHGHEIGDALLIEAAQRLRAGVRGSDLVARLGGDEFALLLYGVRQPADASRRLASIVAMFDQPAELGCGAPVRIGVSVGAALYPEAGSGASEMLRSADIALYQAKNLGRGQGCVFDRSLGAALEQRLSLLAEVRTALERTELDVFYQPIVDLRSLAVRGLEALVRWHHPVRGLLAPGAFQAALADPALSVEIGGFVLARGLRQLRGWLDAGVPATCVNVNLSESQLQRGDALVRQVTAVLEANRLTPDRLKVELLEGAFLGAQSGVVLETLERLQRLGVVVALDDFGTGYASLTHLKQFSVGRIKIDQSFIRGLGTDPSNTAITRAIIDLGRNLGLRVTAEGVEDIGQLEALLQAGCDCAQGFLLSPPLPAERVPEFLARWATDGPALIAAATRPATRARTPTRGTRAARPRAMQR